MRWLAATVAICCSLAAGSPAAQARQLEFVGTADVADLSEFRALAFSPDGRHAYVVGNDAAVLRVEESPGSLRLVFVESFELPVFVSADDSRVLFGPAGRRVYIYRRYDAGVPSSTGGRFDLLVYRRDPASGHLTLLETHGLDNRVFTLSADGQHLYLNEHLAIRTFAAHDGGLDFLRDQGVEELTSGQYSGSILDLASSPDPRRLYLLAQDTPDLRLLLVLRRNLRTGRLDLAQLLSQNQGTPQLDGVVALEPSADDRWLVARSDDGSSSGQIRVFARSATGLVSFLAAYDSPFGATLGRPSWWVESPDGRHLLMLWTDGAGYESGLAVYRRDDSTGVLALAQTVMLDANTNARLEPPRFSPGGGFLVLSSRYQVLALPWNAATGTVGASADAQVIDDEFDLAVGSLAVHPGGEWIVTPTSYDTFHAFRRLPSGRLDHPTLVFGDQGHRVATVLAFSPDGRHLYAAGREAEPGFGQEIQVQEVDAATGSLELVQSLALPWRGVNDASRSLAVSADGRFVVLGGYDHVSTFERDPGGGLLTPRFRFENDDAQALTIASGVVIGPEGRQVYVGWQRGNRVMVFDLDPATGELTPKQSLLGAVHPDPPHFPSVFSLALTPDGRHLLVGGHLSLRVFARDPLDGTLTFAQQLPQEHEVVSLMADAEGQRVVAVLLSGRYLLLVRDAETGHLTPLEELSNDDIGVEGLGVRAIYDPVHGTVYSTGVTGRIGVVDLGATGLCAPGADRLCLGQGNRFEARVGWRDAAGHAGTGRVLTSRGADSGGLWFFGEDNWEVLVKLLDGCALNGRFWLFAAAATSLEATLTITDRATGEEREYFQAAGLERQQVVDVEAFAGCDAAASASASSEAAAIAASGSLSAAASGPIDATADRVDMVAPGPCLELPNRRCLLKHPTIFGGRFQVDVQWRDAAGRSGFGRALQAGVGDLDYASAAFWFYGPDNWELLVKVLDGCRSNGAYWLLAAAATDAEYTLRVIDTATGEVREYDHPQGAPAAAHVDVEAFRSCP